MPYALVAGVLLLAFANGANDNFKGVATLWGTRRYRYSTVLAWGTVWTLAGSLAGGSLARGLVEVFNGSRFLGTTASLDPAFLAAVALGAAATVLLATRLGSPISTTHALGGALVGAGLAVVGAEQIKWAALASSIAMPLLLSPLLASTLTILTYPPVARWLAARSCLCVTQPAPLLMGVAEVAPAIRGFFPGVRIAHRAYCTRGGELSRWNTEELLHWSSASLISFCRGLNDTPKLAALVLTAGLLAPTMNYAVLATSIALGGIMAGVRVARTMSESVTEIEPVPGMTANLVGSLLVGAASLWSLPVSTTHVTLGGIFGVAVHRRGKTSWSMVGQIVLAWIITLPLGFLCGLSFYRILKVFG